jgi:hypothetical protein
LTLVFDRVIKSSARDQHALSINPSSALRID